jgi:hypothetical protein
VSPGDVPPIALWQHAVALAMVVTDIVTRAARSVALMPVGLTKAMIVNCCGDALAAITPRDWAESVRFVWFARPVFPALPSSLPSRRDGDQRSRLGGRRHLLFAVMANTVRPLWHLVRRHYQIAYDDHARRACCARSFCSPWRSGFRTSERFVVFLRDAWHTF